MKTIFRRISPVCFVVACVVLSIFAQMVDVHAAKCGDPDLGSSVAVACYLYKADMDDGYEIPRGVLWISDTGNDRDVSSTVRITEKDISNGKKDLYIHGAIIGGSGDWASHVKFVKGTGRIEGSAAGYKNYSPFIIPSELYEEDDKDNLKIWRNGVLPYNKDIVSSVYKITLDVNKLLSLESENCGGKTRCPIALQVFRCYGYYNEGGGSDCYSDATTLDITVPKPWYSGAAMALDTWENNLPYTEREKNGGWVAHTPFWPGKDDSPKTTYYDIGNCPMDGCDFGFRFYLRANGFGTTTKFQIFETNDEGNYYQTLIKGWDDGEGDGTKYPNLRGGGGKQVYAFKGNVKPGQISCGTIQYDTTDDHGLNSPTRSDTVCVRANAQQPGFQGRSNVWDADHTTGWFGTGNKSETYYINDCATTGCQVALSHYLKRSSGSGTTQYDDVTKKTNGWDEEQQLEKSEYDKEGVTDSSLSRDNGALIVRDTYTLYPGEKICETLNFSSKGDGDKDGHSTVCAVALGSVSSNIKMKVRNGSIKDRNSDSEYQYFNDNTYAKPGDEIEFQATYDAVPQYLENLKVDTIKINGENNTIGGNGALKDKFNAVFFPSWNKGFVAFDQEYTGSDVDSPQTKGETAQDNTVREITKMAETNPLNDDKMVLNESVWTTPSEVTFMREEGNLVAEVSPDGKSDSATLKIPYNFENAIRFDADSMESKPFYAGEKADIDIIPTVNSTFNEYTSAEYATRVDSPQIQVCLSYDELNRYSIECNTKNYDSWNSDGNGGDVVLGGDGLVSFNIPDNPAGTKIYVHARVYPVNSGSGDNTKISGYGGWSDWIHTEKLIAKKPSFQVWGGNTYVGDKITVPVAIKNNLSTGNEEGRGSYIFGSWTELALATKPESGDSGIVSGSNVNMIGSGASLGYAELRGPDSTLIPSRNPENGLGNNVPGMSPGGGSGIDKVNLLRFGAGGFSIPDFESVKVMMGYNGDPESNLPEGNVEVSETTFYHNEGDISISHDISVDRDSPHGSLSEVPKVVVCAKNINIECSVARIDAILIAKETINTCSDINGEGLKSSSGASNQLIINGALYAKTINFNRTYGAATGNNSIVPAEIINYDNSLLISGATSRTSEGELNVEATFELAPRF